MPEPGPVSYPEREQLELLNGELQLRSDMQSDELDGLDRKITTILSATGVVLALVINNVEAFRPAAGVTGVPGSTIVFYAALAILAAGLLVGLYAYLPRDREVVPKPRRLLERYYAAPTDETLAQLIVTRVQTFETNIPFARRKGLGLKVQIGLLGIGGVALTAAYFIKGVQHG